MQPTAGPVERQSRVTDLLGKLCVCVYTCVRVCVCMCTRAHVWCVYVCVCVRVGVQYIWWCVLCVYDVRTYMHV